MSSLYILEISPLSHVGLMKIFSHSVVSCFVLLIMLVSMQNFIRFSKRSNLLFTSLLLEFYTLPSCWMTDLMGSWYLLSPGLLSLRRGPRLGGNNFCHRVLWESLEPASITELVAVPVLEWLLTSDPSSLTVLVLLLLPSLGCLW